MQQLQIANDVPSALFSDGPPATPAKSLAQLKNGVAKYMQRRQAC